MQQKPEHEIVAQYFLVIDVILSTKNFVRSKHHWEYLKQVKIPKYVIWNHVLIGLNGTNGQPVRKHVARGHFQEEGHAV